jgi:hypothetical protein
LTEDLWEESSRITEIDGQLTNREQPVTENKKRGGNGVAIGVLGVLDATIEVKHVSVVVDHCSELGTGEVLVRGTEPESLGLRELLARFETDVGETWVVGRMGVNVNYTRRECFDGELPDLTTNLIRELGE